MNQDTPAARLAALIAMADKQNSAYPQYAGHFDSYRLVRISRDYRTKMGLAFVKGEIAIASPIVEVIRGGPFEGEQAFTVYSTRNECNTSVRAKFVTFKGEAS